MVVPVPAVEALNAAPVEGVSVIERRADGVEPVVVIEHGSATPIDAPMIPAPSITSVPTDSAARAKVKVLTAKPDSGIRIPARPCGDGISVNHPRIVGGDVDFIRVDRLNADVRILRRNRLLRFGLEIAGGLRLLAHCLHRGHHVLAGCNRHPLETRSRTGSYPCF